MSQSPLFDRLRRPEHTGENRCLPCTVLNLVVAVALAGGLAVVSIELAVGVFVLSALAIYLRGYLVPYTPALTAKYLPVRVLEAFGKEPTPTEATRETVEKHRHNRENTVDTEAFLRDHDIVTSEPSGDVRLTDAFERQVNEELAAIQATTLDAETVAELFDADPSEVTDTGRDYPAYEVGIRIRKWPSNVALQTDIATHRALADWTDRWESVPVEQRQDILTTLRTCRTDCPACGGPLAESSETVDSCCVNIEKYAFRCEDCGRHLDEYSDPTKRNDKGLTGA